MDPEAVLKLGAVGTALALLAIILDVWSVTFRAAWQGNVDLVGQGIVVLLFVAITAKLIQVASP